MYIFHLEKRRSERDWHSSYFSRLKLKKQNGNGVDLNRASDEMLDVIKRRIRSGDAVCRWSRKDFLIILHDIEREDIMCVMERLRDIYFDRIDKSSSLDLDWYYSPFTLDVREQN